MVFYLRSRLARQKQDENRYMVAYLSLLKRKEKLHLEQLISLGVIREQLFFQVKLRPALFSCTEYIVAKFMTWHP